MTTVLRVALFTDCFHEINGAAHTCRQFEAYAARHSLPLLCIRCGRVTRRFDSGSVRALELKRSRAAFSVDVDFGFDPLLWRHSHRIKEALLEFGPDVIHIISPGDVGELGAYWAHKLGVPLVASFHTNLHQYAATRVERFLDFLPRGVCERLTSFVEQICLKGLIRFYQIPRLLLAPNAETQAWLGKMAAKPCRIMGRGVDISRFSPLWRDTHDGVFRLGYVGRLKREKNVRLLAEVDRALQAAGKSDYRFHIVGEGSERPWLEKNLTHAEFAGILTGKQLRRAYANMDLFLFPSHTDAFGNAVLEALASGVPAIVTADGGPKLVVESGISGFAAADDQDFVSKIVALMSDTALRSRMARAAREQACMRSWPAVFSEVYEAYRECLDRAEPKSGRAPCLPVVEEAELEAEELTGVVA